MLEKSERIRMEKMLGPEPDFVFNQEKLEKRVEVIRNAGVILPDKYPPKNMESHRNHIHGVLAEIEVAELLIKQFPPESVEILEPDAKQGKNGKPYQGDVDIVIHQDPRFIFKLRIDSYYLMKKMIHSMTNH